MNKATIKKLAAFLDDAEVHAKEVTKITDAHPGMTMKDAYAVCEEIRHIKETRGNKVVGYKMGLTSRAKMEQMGVGRPGWAYLYDYFACPDGGTLQLSELIHPKVEPEIAVMTKAPLKGPGCTIGDVLAAADFVLPAMEIIDSRYKDFQFDMVSVIADNSSSCRFVNGGRMRRPQDVDLKTLGVVMEKNGKIVGMGCGAAVLNHPASAVALLADMFGELGREIPAGSYIMTGGITAAVAVAAGDNITVH